MTAETLIAGFALDAPDAEPMAKALARVLATDLAFAAQVAKGVEASGDVPSPIMRVAVCSNFAWDFYRKATSTGRVEADGLLPNLLESDFMEVQAHRDRVAAALTRTLDWRTTTMASFPGMSLEQVVIEGYALAAPGAEPLAGTLMRLLSIDASTASTVIDMTRVEPERLSPLPAHREAMLTMFAAWAYWRHQGKIVGLPTQIQGHLFHRRWLRDRLAAALGQMFPQLAPAREPAPAAQ